MSKSYIGFKVKDKVSGFKGIVVSEHNYIEGCTRCTVQPKIKKDGTLPNSATFDFPQLIVVKKNAVKVDSIPVHKRTGGPSKFEDEQR